MCRFTIIVTLSASLRDILGAEYSRAQCLDFNRSDEGGRRRRRRRWLSSSTTGFWYSVGARRSLFVLERRAPSPSANKNDTKNRLIRAREHDDEETSSHAFPSDNKGLCRLQHQFLFSYALSAKACRGKSNRGETGRAGGGGGGKGDERLGRGATRDASQKFPRGKLFASNNFKGGTSFLRNDCTKLRRLRWK